MTSYDQNRRWLWIAVIIIGLLVIIFGGYRALKRDGETVSTEKTTLLASFPRMTNLPSMKTTTPPPPPSYPSDAPVLEQARKALREGLDPAEALALARSLPDRPERAGAAFLLFEYAAADILTELLADLTYRSSIMRLTEEDWYRLSVGEQQALVDDLKSKIRRYKQYHDDVANWVSFGRGEPGDAVYRVPLSIMP